MDVCLVLLIMMLFLEYVFMKVILISFSNVVKIRSVDWVENNLFVCYVWEFYILVYFYIVLLCLSNREIWYSGSVYGK